MFFKIVIITFIDIVFYMPGFEACINHYHNEVCVSLHAAYCQLHIHWGNYWEFELLCISILQFWNLLFMRIPKLSLNVEFDEELTWAWACRGCLGILRMSRFQNCPWVTNLDKIWGGRKQGNKVFISLFPSFCCNMLWLLTFLFWIKQTPWELSIGLPTQFYFPS